MGLTGEATQVDLPPIPQSTYYIQPIHYNVPNQIDVTSSADSRPTFGVIFGYIIFYLSLAIITVLDIIFYGWLGFASIAGGSIFGLVFFMIVCAFFTLCVVSIIGAVKKNAALLITVSILRLAYTLFIGAIIIYLTVIFGFLLSETEDESWYSRSNDEDLIWFLYTVIAGPMGIYLIISIIFIISAFGFGLKFLFENYKRNSNSSHSSVIYAQNTMSGYPSVAYEMQTVSHYSPQMNV